MRGRVSQLLAPVALARPPNGAANTNKLPLMSRSSSVRRPERLITFELGPALVQSQIRSGRSPLLAASAHLVLIEPNGLRPSQSGGQPHSDCGPQSDEDDKSPSRRHSFAGSLAVVDARLRFYANKEIRSPARNAKHICQPVRHCRTSSRAQFVQVNRARWRVGSLARTILFNGFKCSAPLLMAA